MSYAKIIIAAVGGFAGGIVSGLILAKKMYHDQYEQELNEKFDDLRRYYESHPEYLRSMNSYCGESDQNEPEKTETTTPEKVSGQDLIDSVVKIDYASMYPVQVSEKSSEEETSLEEQITEQYNEIDKFREPEVISEEEGRDLPRHINSEALFYYVTDDIFTDDYGQIIEEPEFLVGNNIEYLRDQSDGSITYIMNYAQTICYEVQVYETNPEIA